MNQNENDVNVNNRAMYFANDGSNNKLPELTHKQMYDMVNTMTNRKPVRIDVNDNIFTNNTNTNNNNNNNTNKEKIKKRHSII